MNILLGLGLGENTLTTVIFLKTEKSLPFKSNMLTIKRG